jgi:thioesterase domain-containing protein
VPRMRSGRSPTPELSYEPVVTLQYGEPDLAPLFCIPGAAASVTDFRDLAETLPPETPVYGLQPRGLEGQLVPHGDVPSAALAYVRAIRRVQPQGPYRLLGHSFGGWIAFEMALQLAAGGRAVAEVFIVDSEAPGRESQDPKQIGRAQTLETLIELYSMRLERPLPLAACDFIGQTADGQIALLHSALIKAGLLGAATSSRALNSVVRVLQANLATSYSPRGRYLGTLRLISAADATDEELQRRVVGWRNYATTVKQAQITGNHMTVLSIPHVRALARMLGELSYAPS